MGNPKDDKKKIDTAKKEIQSEIKKFTVKLRSPWAEISTLLDEKSEIEAKKNLTPEDKARLAKIESRLAVLRKIVEKEFVVSGKKFDLLLKKHIPDDKTQQKAWEKGFVGGVYDMFEKKPGLKIGKQLYLGTSISIKKKKIKLTLKYKF